MTVDTFYRYDASTFRAVFEHNFTYVAGVKRNSHRYANRPALHDPATQRRWTYAELWADSGRLADALRATNDVEAITRAEHQPARLVAVGRHTAPAMPFGELMSQGDPHADPQPPPDATVYDESTRLYTSGTTAMPKGVSLNSLVDVLSAHDVIMHFPLSPEDRTLNMTPWFHRGGLYSGGPNPVLYVGAESVALRAFDPATVLDWVQEHRLIFLIGAPTNLAMLTAEQSARPRDLSSLNGIRTADPDDHAAKNGTEVGEVAVRSVKAGYAYVNQPDEQAQRFRNGWLCIGDLATWDADEYVTIVGRKDDMIISGGENVHPTQVEAILSQLDGVSDSAVVGVPDDRWGELVVAYVVATDPALDAAACEAHCKGHPMLAAYKRPRDYRFVSELPMTATGKKVHYQLREQAVRDAADGLLVRP